MSNSIIKGRGIPGESTEGVVGQIYIDTDTGIQYECIESEKRTAHDFNKTYYNWIVRKLDASFLATKEEVKAGSGSSVIPQKVLFRSTDSEGNILCCGQKASEMTIEEGLALCISKMPYLMGTEHWLVTGAGIGDIENNTQSLVVTGMSFESNGCGGYRKESVWTNITIDHFKQS